MKQGPLAIKAVIFDVGGVLAYDIWEYLFLDKEKGIVSLYKELDRNKVEQIGKDLWEMFANDKKRGEKFSGNPEACEKMYWAEFIKRSGIQEEPQTFIKMSNDFIKPIEGMDKILDMLQAKNINLAICSNNIDFWYRRQMQKSNLKRFFQDDKVILSCRIGFSKSSPGLEMFRAVSNALELDPKYCVFVDDRQNNIKLAQKHGMTGILFPPETQYGAQYLVTKLNEMGI